MPTIVTLKKIFFFVLQTMCSMLSWFLSLQIHRRWNAKQSSTVISRRSALLAARRSVDSTPRFRGQQSSVTSAPCTRRTANGLEVSKLFIFSWIVFLENFHNVLSKITPTLQYFYDSYIISKDIVEFTTKMGITFLCNSRLGKTQIICYSSFFFLIMVLFIFIIRSHQHL